MLKLRDLWFVVCAVVAVLISFLISEPTPGDVFLSLTFFVGLLAGIVLANVTEDEKPKKKR